MRTLLQDLRYGLRVLRKSPGFTLVAVVSLALGIGANTTIFSMANALLLRPLPVDEPERLVSLHSVNPDGSSFHTFSYPDYQDYREQTGVFEGLLVYTIDTYSLNADERTERVFGMLASGNFFDVMGVRPALGRFFTPDEDKAPRGEAVAVVSNGFWQRRFGSDPGVVGRELLFGGQPYTVVGVAPRGFTGTRVGFAPDVYLPMWSHGRSARGSEWLNDRRGGSLEIVGRLKRGVSVEQAQAQAGGVVARLAEAYPDSHRGKGVEVRRLGTGLGQFEAPVMGFMGVLSAVVGLVLLIACANVAGMALARSATRRKEVAIRLAVGARRSRIVRQLVTESVLLFLIGGAAGVLLAAWLADMLMAFKPPTPFPVELNFGLDWRVLVYALGLSLVTGVVFGLAPALQASRPDVIPSLKDESGGGFRRSRLLNVFVAGQIAVSLVLLVCTGLFLRSLQNARSMDPGFNPDGVQLVGLDLRIQGYDEARGRRFYAELLERLRAAPGVESVTLARMIPLDGGNMEYGINVEGREPPEGRRSFSVDTNVVGSDYFKTLGIPVVRGRDFGPRDVKEAPRVAVINETMARHYWPNEDAVGRRFFIGSFSNGVPVEVVGVAKDGKYRTLGEDPRPYLYLSAEQDYGAYLTLHVRPRSAETAADALAAVRRETAALDPNLPLLDVMPMTEAIGTSLLPIRMAATVAGVLGVVGLVLAGVGIFGVVSFSVVQRTREIGVRMALGAQTRDVLRLVIWQGMRLALAGVGVGLLLAVALSRVLAGLLYGVSPTDVSVFAGVSLLLAVAAFAASYIPARRATKVDPMVALRYE